MRSPSQFRNALKTQYYPAWYALRYRKDPFVLYTVLRSKLNLHYTIGSTRDHLHQTMEWLSRAQDATADGGVSGNYDIVTNSWYPSYPETTGYIIPTFLNYANFTLDENYKKRAVAMGEWLLSLQLDDGAFPGPSWMKLGQIPVVFDTGQILHGLISLYEVTKEENYFHSARRAGQWLVDVLDQDGCWSRYDMDHPHVYNTRTSWALLRLYQLDSKEQFLIAARQNLDWALRNQNQSGWFKHAIFKPGEDPLTHTIAYTIEGLLEAGRLLQDEKYIRSAHVGADALLLLQEKDGSLRGRYNELWKPSSAWSCLTGNAQMAIIWMNLYELTCDERYFNAALAANEYLKRFHSRASKRPGIRGGLAGSQPIYGDYGYYLYVNWAVKFFADSLMLESELSSRPKS